MSAIILRKGDGSTPPIPFDEEQKAKKLIASNHYLSQEKEVGPFMLYLLGDDIESVAQKCNYPKDIMYATAVHYHWVDKREALLSACKEPELIKDIEKNIVNSLLMATWRVVMAEVGAVMSGKADLSATNFVPKTTHGLERLLGLVERLNKQISTGVPEESAKSGTTVVHAQNVQINQGGVGDTQPSAEERRRMLLAEMAKASENKE